MIVVADGYRKYNNTYVFILVLISLVSKRIELGTNL